MKVFLCFLSFMIGSVLFSQIPNIEWSKCYGGTSYDVAKSIQQTTDGGYIVTGHAYSTNGDVVNAQQGGNFWVVKLDSAGNIVWQKTLGGNFADFANVVRQTLDGGYIVIGNTEDSLASSSNIPDENILIVKLDGLGNVVWQQTYGETGSYNSDEGNDIKPTADGGYIAVGSTASYDTHGATDFLVLKLDAYGNIMWQKFFGGSFVDRALSVQQTPDGGYIAAGYTFSSNGDVTGAHGSADVWVLKLDSGGNLLWQKTFGGTGDDRASSIQKTSDGYVVGGFTASHNDGDVLNHHSVLNGGQQTSDFWILKLDESGNIIWQNTLGGTSDDQIKSIFQTSDGGYIACGLTFSNDADVTANAGLEDVWIVRLNSTGILQWQKSMGGSGYDLAFSVQEAQDGSYVVAGQAMSGSGGAGFHGGQDFWIVKFAPESAMGTGGFEPSNISVYPNPVSNILSVGLFNVKSITVTNMEGKILETVQNTTQINLSGYARGTYLVIIEQENGTRETKKVIKE